MLYSARSVALAIGIAALAETAFAGCARSHLRVIVRDPDQRPGTVHVTTRTSHTDPGRTLSRVFDGRSDATANLVFTFDTRPRWSFMVAVTTQFAPTEPRVDECILTCTHLMELTPGHSHRVETPIVILPHACSYYFVPGQTGGEHAAALCAAADSIIRIPNCEFQVTDTNTCTLVCPRTADEDPDPGARSDQTARANEDNGPPITAPAPLRATDAGIDSGRFDAGHDAGSMGVDVLRMDVQTYRPSVCGGVDIGCDGLVDTWPCAVGLVCDANACLAPCVEGSCQPTQTCTSRGVCVDTACLSVSCAPGLLCQSGLCIDPCVGVECTGGQVCRAGGCFSPCPEM